MNRFLIVVLLGAASCLLAPMVVGQDATGEQAEPATVEKAKPTEEERAAKKAEREKTSTWWYADGVAAAVQLSEAQIAQMDELREKDQQRRQAAEEKRRELQNRIEAAFQQGDLNGARKVIDELNRQSGDEYAFKLEVLGLLSAQQMALLKEKYPSVLTDSWRRNTRRLVEKGGKGDHGEKEGGKRKGDKGQAEGDKASTEDG